MQCDIFLFLCSFNKTVKIKMKSVQSQTNNPVIKKRSAAFEIFLFLLIVSFGALSILAKQYPYFGFDLLITNQIQLLPTKFLGASLEFITWLGYFMPGVLLTAILALMLWLVKKKADALVLLISTTGAVVLSGIFKFIIDRPRPDPLLVNQLSPFQTTASFPSGHVLFFVGLLGYLLYLSHIFIKPGIKRIFSQFFLGSLILLMGVSRIYVGAHWFSDTLGAYLIGLVWLLVIIRFRLRIIDFFFKKSE